MQALPLIAAAPTAAKLPRQLSTLLTLPYMTTHPCTSCSRSRPATAAQSPSRAPCTVASRCVRCRRIRHTPGQLTPSSCAGAGRPLRRGWRDCNGSHDARACLQWRASGCSRPIALGATPTARVAEKTYVMDHLDKIDAAEGTRGNVLMLLICCQAVGQERGMA